MTRTPNPSPAMTTLLLCANSWALGISMMVLPSDPVMGLLGCFLNLAALVLVMLGQP